MAESVSVGVAHDVGGRNSGLGVGVGIGVDDARSDLGVRVDEVVALPNDKDAELAAWLQSLVDTGHTSIIAVGPRYAAAVGSVARANPTTHFVIIDDDSAASAGSNVTQAMFAVDQGAYIVGAAAALKSKTDTVGFVGGTDVAGIAKIEAAFTAGARKVNPKITVHTAYTGAADGKAVTPIAERAAKSAASLYQNGADIVFSAIPGVNTAVFRAARSANKMAIGIGADEGRQTPAEFGDVILTSLVKRARVAAYTFVKNEVEGTFEPGVQIFDVAAGGVGYSTTGGKLDDVKAKLDTIVKNLSAHEIVVPTTNTP